MEPEQVPGVGSSSTFRPSGSSSRSNLSGPSLANLTQAATFHVPRDFIMHQHANAIRLLAKRPVLPWLGPGAHRSAMSIARASLMGGSKVWPNNTAVEKDLYVEVQQRPEEVDSGVRYAWKVIDNLPYLALEDEEDDSCAPTTLQQLAFETLSYTYPLLPILSHLPSISTSFSSALSAMSRRSPDSNNRRRAYGQEHHGARNELRYTFAVPRFVYNFLLAISLVLRNPTRLLIPISLIMVRAAFIMYIFNWTPYKSPVWFFGVTAWMCYEIWGIIKIEGARIRAEVPPNIPDPGAARRAAGAGPPVGPAQNGNAPPGADGRQGQPPAANGHAAPQPNGPLPERNPNEHNVPGPNLVLGQDQQIASLFKFLAMFRLTSQWEQLGLDPLPSTTGDPAAPPILGPAAVDPRKLSDPTFVDKVSQFCILFVCSLLPEVWALRINALRIREGRVREVYGREWIVPRSPGEAPEELTPEEAERRRVFAERQALLTGWRRAYVRRVLGGIGQDDDM